MFWVGSPPRTVSNLGVTFCGLRPMNVVTRVICLIGMNDGTSPPAKADLSGCNRVTSCQEDAVTCSRNDLMAVSTCLIVGQSIRQTRRFPLRRGKRILDGLDKLVDFGSGWKVRGRREGGSRPNASSLWQGKLFGWEDSHPFPRIIWMQPRLVVG